jgi:hypothetical protein
LKGLNVTDPTILDQSTYHLHLWKVRKDGHLQWRASLLDMSTGKRKRFSSLEELFEHLQQQNQSLSNHQEATKED